MVSSIRSSGSFTTQAMETMRQNRFKKIDQDGDGKITKEEMSAGRPQNGKGPSVDDVFSKIDANKDGAIDEAEDKAGMEKMQRQHGPGGPPDPSKMAAELFKSADADGDGRISKDELTQALPKDGTGPSVDDIFKSADSDEDGAITSTELEDSFKKMAEQMQANQAQSSTQSTMFSYSRKGTTTSTDAVQSLFSAVA